MSNEPDWQEIISVLNDWEGFDGNLGRFSRGMHLLGHLSRGGTLEEYGRPDWTEELAKFEQRRAEKRNRP